MRAGFLTVTAALALAGCGGDRQAQSDAASTEDLATQNVSGNDITAIDAATGDAVNMAADSEFNLAEPDAPTNEGDGNSADEPTSNAE